MIYIQTSSCELPQRRTGNANSPSTISLKWASTIAEIRNLHVEPETAPDLTARLRCKSELADALDLNVDLIVQQPDQDLPIYRIAKRSGLRLSHTT